MARTGFRWLPFTLLATTLLILACASGPAPGPSPESVAGASARTILVTPFNIVSALPPELEGSTRIVSDALVEHLEAHGKKVSIIAFRAGNQLWKDSMKEVRKSGQKRKFENAARVYARRIGEQVEFDVLIVPSLFIQNAKMRSRVARWDGTEQRIDLSGERTKDRGASFHSQTGTLSVKAASVFVHILDRDGSAIQSKRSGLEVIQHLERRIERKGGISGTDKLNVDLINDNPPIEDKERVRAGVAAVLSPFLPEEIPSRSPNHDAQ